MYQGIENISSGNLVSLLSFPSIATPIFFPVIMFGIFLIFTVSSYFAEKARIGKGNFLSSSAVASFICIVLSVLLNFLGLISTTILIQSIVIYIIFIIFYILSNKN